MEKIETPGKYAQSMDAINSITQWGFAVGITNFKEDKRKDDLVSAMNNLVPILIRRWL